MVKHREGRSGIYLLPNLLTTASLFAAFYSIVASMKGTYETAVMAIFLGMFADGLDGRIARMTNTQTAFGAEYDSLADMVTFGVAPALILYSWILHDLGKLGWLIAFMYTAAVALRLARFNTQIGTIDKRYFQGLACPAAAALVASFVWMCHKYQWEYFWISFLAAGLTVFVAVLMVSNIRYYSFKEVDSKKKVPFLYILGMVGLFVAVALNPSVIFFVGFMLYACSGPLQTLVVLQKVRKNRQKTAAKQNGRKK